MYKDEECAVVRDTYMDFLVGPGGEVLEVLSLALGVIVVATSTNSFRPGVRVGVALGGDVVTNAVNYHVGNNFGEVWKESQVMIVISGHVQSVLLVTTVAVRKNQDET